MLWPLPRFWPLNAASTEDSGRPAGRRVLLSVAALAGAALMLESSLTRLLGVAQFYHFAFLVVSLALLGFGASGTFLSLRSRPSNLTRFISLAGAGFAASTAFAYGVVNWLPFDSYSIAWDRRQILLFALYYVALAAPFFCSGAGIGAALAASEDRSHLVYAANLLGSAGGVVLALAALALAGVPGAVLGSALLGWLPVLRLVQGRRLPKVPGRAALLVGAWGVMLAGVLCLAVLTSLNVRGTSPLGLVVSPYKGLVQALRYPGAVARFGRWNAISRLDVVASAGIRLLPGLSYTYAGVFPPQSGLSIDADSLLPITLIRPAEFTAAGYLPEAVAFALQPGANVLVLEPGGGLGVAQALAAPPPGRPREVTVVIGNPLTRDAVAAAAAGYDPYLQPGVRTEVDTMRNYLSRERARYDVVFLPLTDPFRPVASGAYGLGETYNLTIEAFDSMLARLAPDGLLVATRWFQIPPSESIRLIATLVEAMERRGVAQPGSALVAFRGIQTLTVLARPGGWKAADLARLREFLAERRYDLVWAPDVQLAEVNRFNHLPEPSDFLAIRSLLGTTDRKAYYAAYPFDIAPATDDHPFFFHFFKWRQTSEVLATMGRTWQPFGGSGYLVLWALLALVLVLSSLVILAPLVLGLRAPAGPPEVPLPRVRVLVYFGLIGVAFLFVEIPLIQRWILLLGHPAYAFTAVVLSLLLFSGLGSALARKPWVRPEAAFALLVLLGLITPLLASSLARVALALPPVPRIVVALFSLAPLGFAMGLPFPLGLAWLGRDAPGSVSWAWAVNGACSVLAAVLAAILSLSYGFTVVLLLGAGCYAAAGAILALGPRADLSSEVCQKDEA